ncbi:MAG TPA: guanitoxin biosynthesis heme-dependent pre-guanitoxin N-hydroxylase GntA [Salinimicrobium sp.]|nr:guanitoxin biosynthesis heme-dependent pre-guanitoxin N-hydroxylase GntA [Salinimicrobium sp.]
MDNEVKTESEQDQKTTNSLYADFEKFILENNHPCVMAQSVFTQRQVDFHVYEKLGSRSVAQSILKDLRRYLDSYDFETNDFFTFIAVFPNVKNLSEKQFEELLWKQLQYLHEFDNQPWDPNVDRDVESKNFSFSLLGKSFYLVGMHPNSSRMARRSPVTAMVFNLHAQFEKLREMGAYHNVRDKIRERDVELQGSVNPMLEDFGESSEARQYSGREVDANWKCPFHAKSF